MKLTLTVIFTLLAFSHLANGWAAAVVPGLVGIGTSIMAAMNHMSQDEGLGTELFSNWSSPFASKYESHSEHSDREWLSRDHHHYDHQHQRHDHQHHHMEHAGHSGHSGHTAHTGHTGHTGHSDHSYHYEYGHEGTRTPVSCDPNDPNPRPG